MKLTRSNLSALLISGLLMAGSAFASTTVYGSLSYGYSQANASANAISSLKAQYPNVQNAGIQYCQQMHVGPGWACKAVGTNP